MRITSLEQRSAQRCTERKCLASYDHATCKQLSVCLTFLHVDFFCGDVYLCMRCAGQRNDTYNAMLSKQKESDDNFKAMMVQLGVSIDEMAAQSATQAQQSKYMIDRLQKVESAAKQQWETERTAMNEELAAVVVSSTRNNVLC